MQPSQIAIYGAGGFARELAWLVETCNTVQPYAVVCFMDDDPSSHGLQLNGIPVMGLEEAYSQFTSALVVGGIGSPATRQALMQKAAAAGFGFATLVHPRTECSRWVEIGIGTVICAGNILTTNISIGRHVQINLYCTIGHDVIMGDYCTLAPGVHVSGCVHLGQRSYIGTGAVIINGTKDNPIIIGDDAVVGAGACVTKSVPPGAVVAGVPARPLQR